MSKEITFHLDHDYKSFLSALKTQIKSSQFRAALAVNQEVINHYWYIGKQIIEKQKQKSWERALLKHYLEIYRIYFLKPGVIQ